MSAESYCKTPPNEYINSRFPDLRVLHVTLNDGKIYFKNIQRTSQDVIFFFTAHADCNILCTAAIKPQLGTQSPDTQGADRQ